MNPKKFDKRVLKKSPEELTEYLNFKRRGSVVESRKGKNAPYKRNPKHKNKSGLVDEQVESLPFQGRVWEFDPPLGHQ